MSPDRRSCLRRAWATVCAVLAHGGPLELLRLLARRVLAPLIQWKTLYFFERDLTKPPPEFHARIPVDVRIGTREDLETLRDAFLEAGVEWKEIEERCARGDLCFFALAEGRLAHFMWLTSEPAPLGRIGVTVMMGPCEGYVYSSYTDPALRGLAVQPAVANFMIKHERAIGIERHFFYVLGGNEAGQKIVTARHASAAAQASRVLTCVHMPLLGGVLLWGLDRPGRPRLEVAGGSVSHRLGPLGTWISGWSIDLRAL
jgi:ribosomal protein S18 acetylase RimI-like enzyme